MADEPGPPVEPARVPREEPAAQRVDAGEVQRYGPLAVSRFVKDDGRALLLFERVEPPQR